MTTRPTLDSLRREAETAAKAAEAAREAFQAELARSNARIAFQDVQAAGTYCAAFARNHIVPKFEAEEWDLTDFSPAEFSKSGGELLVLEIESDGCVFKLIVEHGGFAE
ncbi:MAG: hypothetical protein HOE14_11985 [Gemmatimonadales bacterium]|jgi:hypothetical protein|nr:hypothetical protein [Gemmatimonadales bacterium]